MTRRAAGVAGEMAAAAFLVMLCRFNLLKIDRFWDSVAYHFPFAALRTGIVSHAGFTMRPDLEERLRGFPPLVDWVQGLLWRAFHNPAAAEFVSPIAIAVFAAYARWAFGLRLFWSVAIFLAIPILHTALDSAMVDLWTNAFFTIYLMAAFKATNATGARAVGHAMIANLALAVAVNSKLQFFVVGMIAQALLATLLLAVIAHRPTPVQARTAARNTLLVSLLLTPLVFYAPIRNLVLFANPAYPVQVTVLGLRLPGDEISNWAGPARLAGLPDFARYWLSQLDLDAVSGRPGGFTVDQGEQPDGADGNRMGGSLAALFFGSLGLAVMALARTRLAFHQAAALVAFTALATAVACLPGANELRYFSFVNIVATLAALLLLAAAARRGDQRLHGAATGLHIFLGSSVLFTSFVTGLRHLTPGDAVSMQQSIEQSGLRRDLQAALTTSDVVCYLRPDPNALFLAPEFNSGFPHRPYRLVVKGYPEACPPDAAQIR